jgi:hypothetical protein
MHFGIIAGRASLDPLIQSFHDLGIELRFVKALDRLEDAPRDRNAAYIIAGERAGMSYMVDEPMLLSGGKADVLASAAAKMGVLLVGCGAETVSGTFWLSAFDGPNPLRLFMACTMNLPVPFSQGVPLRSEAEQPLDSGLDGEGVWAALKDLGFDYDSWVHSGPFRLLALEELGAQGEQPLEDAIAGHCGRHQLPVDQRPSISAMLRAPTAVSSPPESSRAAESDRRTLRDRLLRILGR